MLPLNIYDQYTLRDMWLSDCLLWLTDLSADHIQVAHCSTPPLRSATMPLAKVESSASCKSCSKQSKLRPETILSETSDWCHRLCLLIYCFTLWCQHRLQGFLNCHTTTKFSQKAPKSRERIKSVIKTEPGLGQNLSGPLILMLMRMEVETAVQLLLPNNFWINIIYYITVINITE